MSLIVTKKTKDLFKQEGLKTSDEAIKQLNDEFKKMCQKIIDTVKNQNLKTVKKKHVPKVYLN